MIFLRNLKVTLRQLFAQKLNSTVHIAGLSLGMTVCLLIALFIRFELSFDNYHPNASRTYRINEAWSENGVTSPYYSTPLPLADAIKKAVPSIEHSVIA